MVSCSYLVNVILFLVYWSCSRLSHPVPHTCLTLFLVCLIMFLVSLPVWYSSLPAWSCSSSVWHVSCLYSCSSSVRTCSGLTDSVPRLPDPALVRLIMFLVYMSVLRLLNPVLFCLVPFLAYLLFPVILMLFLVYLILSHVCSSSVKSWSPSILLSGTCLFTNSTHLKYLNTVKTKCFCVPKWLNFSHHEKGKLSHSHETVLAMMQLTEQKNRVINCQAS